MSETRFRLKIAPFAMLVVLSAMFATADARACEFSDEPAALESCSKAIAAKRLAGPELAKIYATRGSIYYFMKNDHDKAIADYSEAIRLAPKLTKAYFDRAYAYDNGKKDFDRAVADYDSVIRLDPNNAEAFAKRASSYSSKKQYDLAIADLNQAIRLAPKDSSHFFYRGMVYYYHKADYDRAIADFNEAIRLTPDRATYVASRGESYEKKGEFDRALADYRMALSIQPDNTWAKQGLERIERKTAAVPAAPVPVAPSAPISCHDVSGAYQAAIEACTQLIMSGKAGGDELLGAYVWRGSHFSFLGVHDKAIDDFDRALKLDPKLALAYRGRGASYEVKGDLERALADYRMALSIDPSLDDMPVAIQRIQNSRAR